MALYIPQCLLIKIRLIATVFTLVGNVAEENSGWRCAPCLV